MATMDMQTFSHLIASNIAPSEIELSYIRRIASIEENLQSTMVEQIAPFRTVPDNRLQRHSESLNRLQICRRITSVVRRIPPDILSEIFVQWLPVPQSHDAPHISLRELFSISHVCSFWRCVSIATSQLWTFMSLKVDHRSFNDSCYDPLRSVWERTGARALSLSLEVEHMPTYSAQGIQLVLPTQSEYLKTLYLQIPTSLINPMLGRSNFTRLESIVVNDPYESGVAKPIKVFSQSLSLRHFKIDAPFQAYRGVEQGMWHHVPWSQLTYLRIGDYNPTSSAIFRILRICINLVTFIVYFEDHDDDPPYDPHGDITVLLELRILRVTGDSWYAVFFNLFSFPSLEDLNWNLDGVSYVQWAHNPRALALPKFSQYNLRALTLNTVGLSASTLLKLVKASPSLVTLYVIDCDYQQLILLMRALIYDSSKSDNMALRLEHFGYIAYDGNRERSIRAPLLLPMMANVATEMVRSRWRPWCGTNYTGGVACLKTLDLAWLSNILLAEPLQDCWDECFRFTYHDGIE